MLRQTPLVAPRPINYQLRKPSNPVGIPTIALSLDKVLINGDFIFHSSNERKALKSLETMLKKFMENSQNLIRKVVDSDSCVILYYLSCLSGFEDKKLPMANARYMIGNIYNFSDDEIFTDLNKFSGNKSK